jgi:hypothetical protein
MSNNIKNILDTAAWRELEDIFSKAIAVCKDPSNIKPTLDDNSYLREVRARVLAADTMTKFISKIKLSAQSDKKEKISYK